MREELIDFKNYENRHVILGPHIKPALAEVIKKDVNNYQNYERFHCHLAGVMSLKLSLA